MYWRYLVPTNEPTYRGMKLTEEQIGKHEVGGTMTWLCFSSSSLSQRVVAGFGSVTFIFDNSHLTKYAAKNIKHVFKFENEEEYLYPSGAKFRITNIQRKRGDKSTIWISLEEYELYTEIST